MLQTQDGFQDIAETRVSRRQLLGRAATGGAALGVTGLLAACGAGASPTGTASTAAEAAIPRKGGTLRIGIGGGGPADNANPQNPLDGPDLLYIWALFDQLCLVDEEFVLRNRLAEEIASNHDATEWTVRIKSGVEFHNGKTLTADDVLFTYQSMFNPKRVAADSWIGSFIQSMHKLDARTVRFTLNQPMGWFDIAIGDGGVNGIMPVGFDVKKPIGTGPFKLVSFTPGVEAVFEGFSNYWAGKPHLDRLVISTINDDNARLNALISNQLDILTSISAAQMPAVRGNHNLRVYNSPGAQFTPITMRVDRPPFDDVRVRQALRLAVDRHEVVESAYGGYGRPASDLYSLYDPDYDHSLHRSQDLEQAKSLLRQANQTNLSVTLVTSNVLSGTIGMCEVVAQNASLAGVRVNIRQVDAATLFGPSFLSWPLAIDIYQGLRYLTTSAICDGPNATLNETHFKNPRYERLWKEASATASPSRRKELLTEMQTILFNEGGYLIPAYPNALSAYSSRVAGFPARDLRGYGPIGPGLGRLYLTA